MTLQRIKTAHGLHHISQKKLDDVQQLASSSPTSAKIPEEVELPNISISCESDSSEEG